MKFLDDYFKYDIGEEISGFTYDLSILYYLKLKENIDKNVIILTSSLYEANKIYNSLSRDNDNILLFPTDDFLSSLVIASSPELKYKRLETLDRLSSGDNYIIVTNLVGYLKKLPKMDEKRAVKIEKGMNVKRDILVDTFLKMGYKRESIVTASGEIAVRGFIIDIFPLDYEHPIRIEFDDDTIDAIKYFDETTQMTTSSIPSFLVKVTDEIMGSDFNSLFDYAKKPVVVYTNKSQIVAAYEKLFEDIQTMKDNKESANLLYSLEEINDNERIYVNLYTSGKYELNAKNIINYEENFTKLKEDYYEYIKRGKIVYFYLDSEKEKKKLLSLIPDANIKVKQIEHGFILDRYVVIGSGDIEKLNRSTGNYKNNFKIGKRIKDINSLEKGDYVVHVAHGIGVYGGITTLTVKGAKKDFIVINYAGKDKIYVPATKIASIYKYTGKDGSAPKLNKLGGSTWEKTKRYVASKVKDISRELILLYQKRLALKVEPYKSYPEEEVFGSEFKYTLTKDQQKSINEINKDLTSGTLMDRLLCGDVGFGKTEVAMRAMFKTVLNNHQVLYLCPTTILCKQQYMVTKERFKNWPVEIAYLNRHVSTKKAKEILKDLNDGKIDILIGTHRILSKDIKCPKLGLLVVDEEQRFGVSQKEKIKSYKEDVHILTLSATPIPRTLKMALSGLRDLSIIDTPPVNRYPVQTYVTCEEDYLIKDAIYKELSRGGQTFILYNKTASIENYASHIRKLVPDAKVTYAHGQMEKNVLDNIMNDFINHEYDVLICTTIIESGIDIPNVNTLLVHEAENFGLSQLYQIRGRVGRSDRIAYAYLFQEKHKVLSDIAMKRLKAIKEFTELGSGYKIAMRDLSLRGAGDIFGASQAGFVDSVGINLYMKMIEDEVARQKGEEVLEEESTETLLNVSTHISDKYVSDEDVKIEIHQKINEIDSYDKLLQVKEEIEDRFGKIDENMLVYMYEEWFEKLALKYNITNVVQTDRLVEVTLPEEISAGIKGDKLLFDAMNLSKSFNIKYQNKKIIITLYIKNLEKHFIFYLVSLLEKTL